MQAKWLPTLRLLVTKINETFGHNFKEMAVAGEVSLGKSSSLPPDLVCLPYISRGPDIVVILFIWIKTNLCILNLDIHIYVCSLTQPL